MTVDWDDFRYVLALHRAGSLGAAARSLKVEQSTAGRRLAALEGELGTPLVVRTPEGVSLTPAGVLAAELAATIDRGVEDLVRSIGGEAQRLEGVVKLATTDATAGFLMAGLVPLREAYPKIRVELVVGNTAHDLLRREADLALRLFRETSPTLIARKVGDIGWSLYAAPAYLERTRLTTPCDLVGALTAHAVIGFGEALSRSPGAKWLATQQHDDVVIRADSIAAVINAAKAGLGVAVAPCFSVPNELVRVTPQIVASTEAYLVIPPDHRDTARVRVVMDAVTALFDRNRDLLAGAV